MSPAISNSQTLVQMDLPNVEETTDLECVLYSSVCREPFNASDFVAEGRGMDLGFYKRVAHDILLSFSSENHSCFSDDAVAAFLEGVVQAYESNHTSIYNNFKHGVDMMHFISTLIQETSVGTLLEPHDQLILLLTALCLGFDSLIETIHQDIFLLTCSLHKILTDARQSGGLFASMDFNESNDVAARVEDLLNECKTGFTVLDHSKFIQLHSNGVLDATLTSLKDTERLILMKFLLQVAYLSNVSRPWTLCQYWLSLLFKEKALQKNSSDNLPDVACAFIDTIALPYFITLSDTWPSTIAILDRVKANRKRWDILRQAQSTAMDAIANVVAHQNE